MSARRAGEVLTFTRDEPIVLPGDLDELELRSGRRSLKLTNLGKVFFPEHGITKGDLLRYYAEVGPSLLPHLCDRAMVMKRFPNGIHGKFFFMKRTPAGAPGWVQCCRITHGSGNVIDFPMANDALALLWLINLGCIDLNPWYATCDDIDRPDVLHFDLDPVPPAGFGRVRECALIIREALAELGAKSLAKTTGSEGIHVYVPIVRGPLQKQVWSFAKSLSFELARRHSSLMTAEYRIAKRPPGRVLVDYNQNAWGRTLASVYSVRPRPGAPVSMPVTWDEVEAGVEIADFTLRDVPARLRARGDLWKPMLAARGRFDLGPHL